VRWTEGGSTPVACVLICSCTHVLLVWCHIDMRRRQPRRPLWRAKIWTLDAPGLSAPFQM